MEQYFKWCIKRGGKLSTRLEKMGNRKKVRGKITVALIGMAVLMFGNCLTAAGNGGEISIMGRSFPYDAGYADGIEKCPSFHIVFS